MQSPVVGAFAAVGVPPLSFHRAVGFGIDGDATQACPERSRRVVAEYVAQAVVARVTGTFERDQVAARVVVLGVAAIGGCFVVDNGGLAGFGSEIWTASPS